MPTHYHEPRADGGMRLIIDYTGTEWQRLICPGADLAPSCLTPQEIARAQTNGQLVAPVPRAAAHQLCTCDHFDWRHADGPCTGEDARGCACPGLTLSTAPNVYAPWEAAVEAIRAQEDTPAEPIPTARTSPARLWYDDTATPPQWGCEGHYSNLSKHLMLAHLRRTHGWSEGYARSRMEEARLDPGPPIDGTPTEAPSVPVGASSAPYATPEPGATLEAARGLPGETGETVLAYLARTAQEAGQAWDTAECEAALVMLDKSQIPAHVPVERWHTALGRCGFAWLGEVRHG